MAVWVKGRSGPRPPDLSSCRTLLVRCESHMDATRLTVVDHVIVALFLGLFVSALSVVPVLLFLVLFVLVLAVFARI